ncbi:hypothetical protein [Cryptosporangium phraense]|uniref:hypothetical protein n=1 Tax=Cryptosporangium phraense TaxID=2593070 RepID=UPI00147925DE|nr:hypothetical protein [Cryptosporangium phraense]
MFSLTEEFAKAQYDYTRERLAAGARRRPDEDAPGRHRASLRTLLFARSRLRPS